MKIKLSEVSNIRFNIERIVKVDEKTGLSEYKVPISVSVSLGMIYHELENANKTMNEKIQDLLKVYTKDVEPNKDGGKTIPKEKQEDYFKEVQEITEQEVDVSLNKVSKENFDKWQDGIEKGIYSQIPANILLYLFKVIEQ